jgi:hypothetical protein
MTTESVSTYHYSVTLHREWPTSQCQPNGAVVHAARRVGTKGAPALPSSAPTGRPYDGHETLPLTTIHTDYATCAASGGGPLTLRNPAHTCH